MNFNLNILSIFSYSEAKGVPKLAINIYIVYIQLVRIFMGRQCKNSETRQGQILPAIKNIKGKYCLFEAFDKLS